MRGNGYVVVGGNIDARLHTALRRLAVTTSSAHRTFTLTSTARRIAFSILVACSDSPVLTLLWGCRCLADVIPVADNRPRAVTMRIRRPWAKTLQPISKKRVNDTMRTRFRAEQLIYIPSIFYPYT